MTYRTSAGEIPLEVRERMLAGELRTVRGRLAEMPDGDPLSHLLASEETRIEIELDHVRRALGTIAPRRLPRRPEPKQHRPLMVFGLLYLATLIYLWAPWR